MYSLDITQLVARSREGDLAAVETLVNTFQMRIFRLSLSILDDPAEADEATQEAFLAAIGKLNSYRGEASFATWLYAIALNVCRGRLRKHRTQERLDQVLRSLGLASSGDAHPEQMAVQHETDAALWQAIQELSDNERAVIVMRYYHGMRLNEIAQAAGVSERTVRTRLHTAHERLRIALSEAG
jgi:RNA polymerase sigma-70 factor (ECF subfamily)